MRRLLLIILNLILLLIVISCKSLHVPVSNLWPKIEPYETGILKVSGLHELYYELSGNPEGKPVFVLHGGPGGRSSPYMRRFFNPDKFLIVLFDQRGAGKSKPFAVIKENTTWDLVDDIEKLRNKLNLGKIILFGGSWGSTLGLAYAETYPENVSGLVLRGIFTSTKEEIDHFYNGGVRKFFPHVYDDFISSLQKPDSVSISEFLVDLMLNGTINNRYRLSRLWAEYEIKISSLNLPDSSVDRILEGFNPIAFGLIENYYMANGCFLEEGQLLDNAYKIKDIPLVMVNGRYDMICPPINAYRLHQRLPDSKLIIAEESGHWMGEKNIENALIDAMKEFE